MWKWLMLAAIGGGIYAWQNRPVVPTETPVFDGYGEARIALKFPNGRELEVVGIRERPALTECSIGKLDVPDFCNAPGMQCSSTAVQCKTGEPSRYKSMLAKQAGEVAYAHFAQPNQNMVMAFWGTTAEEARKMCGLMRSNYRGPATLTCM